MDKKQLELDSQLSIKTISELQCQLQKQLVKGMTLQIDGSQVSAIDIPCLQLLVSFFRTATVFEMDLQWQQPSKVLLSTAKALGMINILKLEHENDSNSIDNDESNSGWRIIFKPSYSLFHQEITPLDLIHSFKQLGQLDTNIILDKLPIFDRLKLEECYLAWEFVLNSDCDKVSVAKLFEWCDANTRVEINSLKNIKNKKNKIALPLYVANERLEALNLSNIKSKKSDNHNKLNDVRLNHSQSIRINIKKVDTVLEKLQPLISRQTALSASLEAENELRVDKLKHEIANLEQEISELKESVFKLRMIPISTCFSRLPRFSQDVAFQLNKQVTLNLAGETIEVDKLMVNDISDLLTLLIHYIITHAFVQGEQSGLTLSACHQESNLAVEFSVNDVTQCAKCLAALSEPDANEDVNLQKTNQLLHTLSGHLTIAQSPENNVIFNLSLPLVKTTHTTQKIKVS